MTLEGKLEGKQEVAKEMLQEGKPIAEIIEFTDLTEEELRHLL